MNYAFFVFIQSQLSWLAMSRELRAQNIAQHLHPLLEKSHPHLKMRYFDAEAFTTICTDVMLLETQDPQHYYFFIEALRDSPLIAHGYFSITQIVASIEDGFELYEKSIKK